MLLAPIFNYLKNHGYGNIGAGIILAIAVIIIYLIYLSMKKEDTD
jgi:hypothetical protein